MLPGEPIVFTPPILVIFASWLAIKWRDRPSTLNFISTTLLASVMAWGLILWLGLVNKNIAKALDNTVIGNPELWRLMLFFALFIDIGKRLVSRAHIDRLLTDPAKEEGE